MSNHELMKTALPPVGGEAPLHPQCVGRVQELLNLLPFLLNQTSYFVCFTTPFHHSTVLIEVDKK